MLHQEHQQELQNLHWEWKSEKYEGLELPLTWRLENKIIMSSLTPPGTGAALCKTRTEVPMSILFKKVVVEQWQLN